MPTAHLDPDLLAASRKPFFGYSDNTNLHLFRKLRGRRLPPEDRTVPATGG
jgi:hypothetical protein